MVVVHIGQDFSRKLAAGQPAQCNSSLDGRKSNSAQLVNDYIGNDHRPIQPTDWRLGAGQPPSEIVDRILVQPQPGVPRGHGADPHRPTCR